MTDPLCHTKIQDIPWFMSIADNADTYLSNKEPEELSYWYQKLTSNSNE